MDEYFLTSEIMIINNNIYYENDDEKIKILNKNWHKYLADLGWRKLNKKWIKKLNCFSKKKNCGVRWGIRSCGVEGDCLFDSISEAFNYNIYYDNNNTKDFLYDALYIRNKVSECLNINNFDHIITLYRIGFLNGEYSNQWNPYMIETVDDLKKELQKSGENFIGDHIILELIMKAFDINIIIIDNTLNYINQNFNKDRKTVILYYNYEEEDFKLMGLYDKKIKTMFNFEDIPQEFRFLCNLDKSECEEL
jgi:hypothetical protein